MYCVLFLDEDPTKYVLKIPGLPQHRDGRLPLPPIDDMARAKERLQPGTMSLTPDANVLVAGARKEDRKSLTMGDTVEEVVGRRKRKFRKPFQIPSMSSPAVASDISNFSDITNSMFSSGSCTSTSTDTTSHENRKKWKVAKQTEWDTGQFLIDKIVGERNVDGKREYKVKWVGYTEVTWEPEDNVQADQDSIKAYQELKSQKKEEKRAASETPVQNVPKQRNPQAEIYDRLMAEAKKRGEKPNCYAVWELAAKEGALQVSTATRRGSRHNKK